MVGLLKCAAYDRWLHSSNRKLKLMDIGKNGHRRRTKLRQQQTIGKGVVENEIKAGGKSWLYRINREMNASKLFKFLPKLPPRRIVKQEFAFQFQFG